MKHYLYIMALAAGVSLTGCVDELKLGDSFLEKAPGVDVNAETVFSKAEYTRNFLWGAYGQLYCEFTSSNCMNGAPIDVLSDSWHCYVSWGGPKQSYYTGGLTEDAQDTDNSNFQGKFSYSTKNPSSDADGRVSIYETVRKCWQLIENIPNVPDMTDTEKEQLKGEAFTIMASRYFDAFRNFGGLCLVDHAYGVGEDFTQGRSTAWQTVQFIDSLIQCAINQPGFPMVIDDIDNWGGRLTKASALALRCKLWMFAASPLFNDDKPYMEYSPEKVTEFTNIEHVWFGKKDPNLWQNCLEACKEFFKENGSDKCGEEQLGKYNLVWPQTKDEVGYRKAYRAAYHDRASSKNHEKLFDAQPQYKGSEWGWSGFEMDCLRQGGMVPTVELMEMFGMADGTNYPYANADIYGVGKNPKGIDIFVNRDPRLYETMVVPREVCNQLETYKGLTSTESWVGGIFQSDNNMNTAAEQEFSASGLKMFKWVLDFWNIGNEPLGVSYIRLAEVFLIRAEARAETGDLRGALEDLNLIRSRVGLGKIQDMNPQLDFSNKDVVIKEILRERNCEIGGECGDRIYDMIRRKLQDDFTKPLHEIKVYRLDANGERMTEGDTRRDPDLAEPWPKFEYDRPVITNGARRWWEPGYWTNKWYLDPVSRIEIQKGYGLTQNPGW